jgi:hypothetical protein
MLIASRPSFLVIADGVRHALSRPVSTSS